MAINQNHLFEDLDGVKCAIVEKNAGKDRVDFLKKLLGLNGYTVVVVPSPPPKAATPETPVEPSSTFTIGVTDVSFNPTNAIFGRLLRTEEGKVVTLAYWNEEDKKSNDEKPYFQK